MSKLELAQEFLEWMRREETLPPPGQLPLVEDDPRKPQPEPVLSPAMERARQLARERRIRQMETEELNEELIVEFDAELMDTEPTCRCKDDGSRCLCKGTQRVQRMLGMMARMQRKLLALHGPHQVEDAQDQARRLRGIA